MDQYAGSSSSFAAGAASVAAVVVGSSVIPLVTKLQDIFSQPGSSTIDQPQVVVVGSHSSGKSTVPKALVGRDFLPRGPGICTRRPIVLQLVHQLAPRLTSSCSYPDAAPSTSVKSAARSRQTNREAGGIKGVSDRQIRLKIHSPNVLNITLVNLSGIIKVPVGDQPTDIEARIRTMILSYIKNKSRIIFAVSPANADLANSDALQMARTADLDGSRTIGVTTELGTMDRGTGAHNFLLGSVIPLRLGYVGARSRISGMLWAEKKKSFVLNRHTMVLLSTPWI